MPQLDQKTADKVDAIRTRMNNRLNEVRSNGDLNDDARIRNIAKAYTTAKTDMNALEQSFGGSTTKTVESLTQQVFGASNVTGEEAMSARDADDRAAGLRDGTEGLELLSRTESNGDKVLARAIALRAFNERRNFGGTGDWGAVLDRYAETHPGVAEKMLEIEAAQAADRSVANMWAFVVPKPSELGRLNDYAIAGLGASS